MSADRKICVCVITSPWVSSGVTPTPPPQQAGDTPQPGDNPILRAAERGARSHDGPDVRPLLTPGSHLGPFGKIKIFIPNGRRVPRDPHSPTRPQEAVPGGRAA